LVRAAKPRTIAKAFKGPYVGSKLTFTPEQIVQAARSSVAVVSPAKEIILHQTAIIIAIKSNKGIFDLPIGHENHLFIHRGCLIVPGLDHHRI
jgi:hypothetical protein